MTETGDHAVGLSYFETSHMFVPANSVPERSIYPSEEKKDREVSVFCVRDEPTRLRSPVPDSDATNQLLRQILDKLNNDDKSSIIGSQETESRLHKKLQKQLRHN